VRARSCPLCREMQVGDDDGGAKRAVRAHVTAAHGTTMYALLPRRQQPQQPERPVVMTRAQADRLSFVRPVEWTPAGGWRALDILTDLVPA
jgi:hypothetical protein